MSLRRYVRRAGAPIGRPLRRSAIGLRTRGWPAHSRLFIAQEGAEWVLRTRRVSCASWRGISAIQVGPDRWVNGVGGQSVFHESQFTLLLHDFERRGNNLGFAYFHGRPGTPGFPEFDACFEALRRRHGEIDRIQVTNRAMEELVPETGVAAEKIHRIPIGIDRETFRVRTPRARTAARRALDLPDSAFVVGSFQKDGVGWGEGLEPKLIKGPDVSLAVAERLRERVPELLVPAHGPVARLREGRARARGVPYRHFFLPDVEAVAKAYEAIDLCLVTSREEGGPKAVLEAMAIGVPLVTTRVGQAADLVRHGENGWMVDVEDVDGLVEWSAHVAAAPRVELEQCSVPGAATAMENSYEALTPAWRGLLDGFVAIPRTGSRVSGMDLSSARAGRYARAGARWARLLVSGKAAPGVRVFYGHDRVPAPGERAAGGSAKMQKLAERFPNSPTDFSLLYLGTTWLPRDLGPLLGVARRRGAPIVVNQDGVGYPGWAGDQTEEVNRPLRRARSRCGSRALPERVLQALRRSLPRRADRLVGGPGERGRREQVPARGDVTGRRAGSAPRGRSDPAVPARAGVADAGGVAPAPSRCPAARHRPAGLARRAA